MSKEKKIVPKYRSWETAHLFSEPVVDWGVSLTDPSQNISVERLVAAHIRAGSPAHGLVYGDDMSRVGFTELSVELQAARSRLAEARQAEASAKREVEEKAKAAGKAARDSVLARLRAGSPELQALASDLTRILPGFEASVAAEGGSKA